MNTETERIAELLRPSLTHLGVDLVDVVWSGRGRGAVLRVVIDRSGGVTLDDCERVSNAASAVLDAADPIDSSYRLEVSSPGAERPLRSVDDWRAALGRRVNVRLHSGDGERVIEGTLVALSLQSAPEESQTEAAVRGTADVEVRERNRRRMETVALDQVLAARIAVDI
ncbi:MAG TPA: ribosome maturation factor RimP [Candidatus Dormibacteraeota bacterium]